MKFVRLSIFFPLFYIVNGNGTDHKSLWDDDEDNEVQVLSGTPLLTIYSYNAF